MAITFPTVFQSSITTDPAATGAGYLTPARYNQGCSIAGLSSTSGALLYSTDATTLAQDGTNLLYTTSSGPRLQVGSGNGTSMGMTIGYHGSSGRSSLWGTNVTPGDTNYIIDVQGTAATRIGAGTTDVYIVPNGGTAKFDVWGAAGRGVSITAGTATTDLNALSATQTWNASGVAFTGWKFTITDTASAAGSLAMQILGGASGTTLLSQLDKSGNHVANIYGSASVFELYQNIAAAAARTVTSRALSFSLSAGAPFLSMSSSGVIGFTTGNGTSADGGNPGNLDAVFSRITANVIGVGTSSSGGSTGSIRAKHQSSDGTAGVASFGPSAVTSITVKDGIITAIS